MRKGNKQLKNLTRTFAKPRYNFGDRGRFLVMLLSIALTVCVVGIFLLRLVGYAYDMPKIILPLPGTDNAANSSERLYLDRGGLDIIVSVPSMTDTPSTGMAVMLYVIGNNHGNRSDNMTADDNRQIQNGTFVPHVFEFTRFVTAEGFELDAGYARSAEDNPHDSSVTPFDACFNISPVRYGQINTLLGTLYMNYPPDEYGGYLQANAYFAKGNCEQALNHTSPGAFGHSGYVQVAIGGAQDPGPGNPSFSITNTGTGTSATGAEGTSAGAGAGGGGSAANTRSDDLNAIPSSSSQGESRQPEIEASPFFDGKLFVAGSSTDSDSNARAVSIGGFNLGYGWFYAVGSFIVLGCGGYFGWKWRHGRTPK